MIRIYLGGIAVARHVNGRFSVNVWSDMEDRNESCPAEFAFFCDACPTSDQLADLISSLQLGELDGQPLDQILKDHGL